MPAPRTFGSRKVETGAGLGDFNPMQTRRRARPTQARHSAMMWPQFDCPDEGSRGLVSGKLRLLGQVHEYWSPEALIRMRMLSEQSGARKRIGGRGKELYCVNC